MQTNASLLVTRKTGPLGTQDTSPHQVNSFFLSTPNKTQARGGSVIVISCGIDAGGHSAPPVSTAFPSTALLQSDSHLYSVDKYEAIYVI